MKKTIVFKKSPSIRASAAVGGNKESASPYAHGFDEFCKDDTLGKKSWEEAEAELGFRAAEHAIKKSGLIPDLIIGGDLQSQCTATTLTARKLALPYLGLYGACSTMAESLVVGAGFVAGDFFKAALCVTSSHYCAAERQFRTPLDYGSKRTPTAQWTVTAGGAVILSPQDKPPFITKAMVGRVVDLAVKDPSNMGAAMAPAAVDTLMRFLSDTGTTPSDYNAIYTGDLGLHGSDMFAELLKKEGATLTNHVDCGCLIYDVKKQDVQSGASGCGCSASMLSAEILPKLHKNGGKILFIATGALLSPLTVNQGGTIPCIAHLVEISMDS